jgi:Plasmid pRiA4b ORF-3-like protein
MNLADESPLASSVYACFLWRATCVDSLQRHPTAISGDAHAARRESPMIWRRLLVRSDSTIADQHYTLQTAFGWSDEHLHRFGRLWRSPGLHRA